MTTITAGFAGQQHARSANCSPCQSITLLAGVDGSARHAGTCASAELRCRSLADIDTTSREHPLAGEGRNSCTGRRRTLSCVAAEPSMGAPPRLAPLRIATEEGVVGRHQR